MRPLMTIPITGSSNSLNAGWNTCGILKVMPSSPPVHSDSCDIKVENAVATASVIMAKNTARTRSENKPITVARITESRMANPVPTASAVQPGSIRLDAMATP